MSWGEGGGGGGGGVCEVIGVRVYNVLVSRQDPVQDTTPTWSHSATEHHEELGSNPGSAHHHSCSQT